MTSFSNEESALLSERLAEGIEQLGLHLATDKQQLLLDYLQQLLKWNKAYNLSGIKEPHQMLSLHLLDSLSILPHIQGQTIMDVGTGAGLPGIPIAICGPEKNVSLLDSNGKKTRFLFQLGHHLAIKNINVINERVENYQNKRGFDVVISRAFASLALFVTQTRHLLGEEGKLLAMKGQYPQAELAEIPDDFKLLSCPDHCCTPTALQSEGPGGCKATF